MISFRVYDTYFHHDIRGHSTGVILPRSMQVGGLVFFFVFFFFLQFSYRFFPLCLSLLIFLYIVHLSHIFVLALACSLRQVGLLKKVKVKGDFQNSIFQGFFGGAFKSFWCPPNMYLRTDTLSI